MSPGRNIVNIPHSGSPEPSEPHPISAGPNPTTRKKNTMKTLTQRSSNLFTLPFVAALSLAAPVALSACATTQTHGAQLDDENTKNRVGRALTSDSTVKRTQVDVDVIDGVAYLRGEVDNASMRDRAGEIAAGVRGVRSVDNQLVFPKDKDVDDGHPDAWITTTITTKLMADDETKIRNIDVDTEDGIVTLSGIVENVDEKHRAAELALETDGVVSVINELQIGEPVRKPS